MGVFQEVVVATDADEVAELCGRMGAPVVRTDPDHPSGTDRVAEVARLDRFAGYDIVANVQGDEPLVRAGHLADAVSLVRDGGWDVGTCAAPLQTHEARRDPAVVKVARAQDGRALYFSRAAIPYRRDAKPSAEELTREPFLRHIGVYVYRRGALLDWVARPPSPLEELERLEQLRALEAGMAVGVAIVEGAAPGVDTPADVIRMEELLSRDKSIFSHSS
jgi:3-deoxy-manno-octulosonate cytidylyltransferase (CMP-KDO synthetase)